MVEVSWIEKPAGRSSGCMALRMRPRLGVWPYAGTRARTRSTAVRASRASRISALFQAYVFERRRPRIRVDHHERRIGYPRPDAARPDVFEDRRDPHAVGHDLLDLVQERLALLAIGLARLLLVERVDLGIAAVGVRALARIDLRHPRGGVAVERARADAETLRLLRLDRRKVRGALHRPHLQPDANGLEVADDRLTEREVRRQLIELAGVEAVGIPGFGQELLGPNRIVRMRLDRQRELEGAGDEIAGGRRGAERLRVGEPLAVEGIAGGQTHALIGPRRL